MPKRRHVKKIPNCRMSMPISAQAKKNILLAFLQRIIIISYSRSGQLREKRERNEQTYPRLPHSHI